MSGRRRGLKRALVVLVIIIIAYVVASTVTTLVYKWKIDREIKRIQSQGDSVGLGWMSGKRIPKEFNGARFYRAAALAMIDYPHGAGDGDTAGAKAFRRFLKSSEKGKPWPKEYEKELRAVVANNRHTIRLLRRTESIERSRFELKWSDGFGVLMVHLSELRNLARLLALDANLALHDGDMEHAVGSVKLGLGLRRPIADEPVIISSLVGYVIDTEAFYVIEEFRGRDFVDTDGLRELISILEKRGRVNGITQALKGERSIAITTVYNALRKGDTKSALDSVFWSNREGLRRKLWVVALKVTPLVYIDEYRYLKIINRMIERSRQPFPQRLDAKEENSRKAFIDASSPYYIPSYCFLTRELLPALHRMNLECAKTDAKTSLARAAIGLEVYRHHQKKYPKALSALVGDVLSKMPMDPFSGNPVVYRLQRDSYLLYSVGEDRKDDGGIPADLRRHPYDGDMVWGALRGAKKPASKPATAPARGRPL